MYGWRQKIIVSLLFMLVSSIITVAGFPVIGEAGHSEAADLTTKYRVYQNDRLLQEFSDRSEAIRYGQRFLNSYVEEIESRSWIDSNFPRYAVYQRDNRIGKGYHRLEDAIREARKWSHSSVRDLHGQGWIWDNYPRENRFRVFQGEKSLDGWTFTTLSAAQAEASKWANSHIIDLADHTWVWDNLSDDEKAIRRDGHVRYEVRVPTAQEPGSVSELRADSDNRAAVGTFAYLEDAVHLASQTDGAVIVNTDRGEIVYANEKPYVVSQNRKPLRSFGTLEEALNYAVKWAHADLKENGREIWNNYPFYRVQDREGRVTEHSSPQLALAEALQRPKAVIRNLDGDTIWDNSLRLRFWAWTGSASEASIRNWVNESAGLDVVSPTWFQLQDASGNVSDASSQELTRWLHARNIEVHPLVHNQFDADLTEAFLASEEAQTRFIRTVVDRTVAAGADGINVDFESMKGSDRNAYTDFIARFAAAAHDHGLHLSIDLPRGSVDWNHLTAFDHSALVELVDSIHIMTYDQHWSGSKTPGAVAGMAWVRDGVEQFLAYGIPRDKLMMGVPFYIREWKLDSDGQLVDNRALYAGAVEDRLRGKDYTSEWDPQFDMYRVQFEEDGFTYVFWLEDANSVQARLQIAKQYRLNGVSAWRLGQEADDFWPAMVQEKN